MSCLEAFKKEENLISEFGEGNAYLVWAISLYMDFSNPFSVGAESLTDGPNDRKIDFLKVEIDNKRVICAQGYYTNKNVDAAPANKASDLNTAAAWILNGDEENTPDNIKEKIVDIRKLIESGDVEQIYFMYVHNLPESIAVSNELNTLKQNVESSIKDKNILVFAKEVGYEEVDRIYNAKESHIKVTDSIKVPSKYLFKLSGPQWKSYVISAPGHWLRDLYMKYGDDLYSANYRGFLGTHKRKKINTGIKQTAENDQENFWVYNNGITVLTRNIKEGKLNSIEIDGISIINGAQTSGSIGSVEASKHELNRLTVMCRIIECSEKDVIDSIVKYNNTQNEITTWDQYSNSPEQHRIEKEFRDIGYVYSLKRGFESSDADISIESVATPLVAFDGNYRDANIGKNYVFDTKSLYRSAFDGKKARHILFVYSISIAIDEIRTELRKKSLDGSIIDIEEKQIKLFQNLKYKNFLMSVYAETLQTIIGKKIDKKSVSFAHKVAIKSNNSFRELVSMCIPSVKIVHIYLSSVVDDFSSFIKTDNPLETISSRISGLVYASKVENPDKFLSFSDKISSE